MTHALKTWPAYYKAVIRGDKTFEIRKDDRDFKEGDTLLLQEFDPMAGKYTGEESSFIITYLLRGDAIGKNFGVMDGFVVLGIKEKDY